MKSLLLCLLLVLSAASARAQHCPFDNTGIIVLRVHAEGDTAVIPALRISLLDSLGRVARVYERDSAFFWQNPVKTSFRGYIDNANPAVPEKIRFPFAKDNYVIVCSARLPAGKYSIRIEDTGGEKNGGNFKSRVLQLRDTDVYPLCDTYDREVYPEQLRNGKKYRYQPVDVGIEKE